MEPSWVNWRNTSSSQGLRWPSTHRAIGSSHVSSSCEPATDALGQRQEHSEHDDQ